MGEELLDGGLSYQNDAPDSEKGKFNGIQVFSDMLFGYVKFNTRDDA